MNKSAFMKRTQHHIFMSGGAAVSSPSIDKEVVHSKYVKLHSTKIVEYGVEAVMYRHKKSGNKKSDSRGTPQVLVGSSLEAPQVLPKYSRYSHYSPKNCRSHSPGIP